MSSGQLEKATWKKRDGRRYYVNRWGRKRGQIKQDIMVLKQKLRDIQAKPGSGANSVQNVQTEAQDKKDRLS